MKTSKIILAAAMAVLVAGCQKEESANGRYRIFAEQMSGGSSSKVLMDASDLSAEWLAGETVNINNHTYTINDDGNGGYQVSTGDDDLGTTLYAIYPGGSFGGNDIEVTHTGNGTGNEVVLKSLVLNFHDGKHDVVFPMATQGITAESSSITFEHLTGGLKLTLYNGSGSSVTLGSLKVVAQNDSEIVPLSRNGVTCRWAVQGPTLPSDTVGQEGGDVIVSHCSEMYFKLKTSGNTGVTIAEGETLSFCVPITVSSLQKISVVGYGTNGTQLFSKSKPVSATINYNIMYSIPAITL